VKVTVKIEWPKPQFWLIGAVILFALRIVVFGPANEYAWLNLAISEESSGFALGYIIGLAVQVVIITFICSWIWNSYQKRKQL